MGPDGGSARGIHRPLRVHSGKRAGLLALVLCASVALYFGALWAAGLQLRQMLRR